jgi:hypothetical protein
MNVVRFQRQSLREIIEDLGALDGKQKGVIAVICDRDGHARFRISGFPDRGDTWVLCGLLDWIKADLLHDLVETVRE